MEALYLPDRMPSHIPLPVPRYYKSTGSYVKEQVCLTLFKGVFVTILYLVPSWFTQAGQGTQCSLFPRKQAVQGQIFCKIPGI